MAAYAALVSLMNDLELIQNHPRHSFSFDNKQIASLSQTVHFLIDFMEIYDFHGCGREAVEVLESRIASAALAAHDVVESHVVDQIHAGTTLDGKARSHFLPDLQKAIDDMGLVKREAMQFEARCGIKAEQITYSPPTSSKPLTSEKNCMVGFDAVLRRLMEMLTGEPSSPLLVIPIEGMGGIGKTTLAKNAYDHLLIQYHFDVRCWATISQEYSVGGILTELVSGKRNSTVGNVNELGEELHKKLWGRRYLIILDDMWSEDAWDEVQMFLPDTHNGSRVIVTTRLSNLATYLSRSPFKMNFLDEDESWKLFCGKAFEEEECPAELEGSGRRIVERCGGLPLAIVVIGGHLRKSWRAIEYWEMVAGFMNPVSSLDEDEKCMNVVSLSYHQLPVCLKPCFLYFGIFEEDEFIDVPRMLRLWVSEGFVKAKEGLSLEEVAEDYLEDLIDRNLVIVRTRRWNGKAEECGIHDIVRELCLKVGKKEKFVCVLDSTQAQLREGRIAAIPSGKHVSDVENALESAPLLRSLMRSSGSHFDLDRSLVPVKLRLLRVSDSVTANICSWGADIQRVNLRYFASFFEREIRSLPWSISLCWNLQTINMRNCYEQISAPQEIWEMAQLRHLEFYQLHLPNPLPDDQHECIILRNLQTLVKVQDFRLTEEVCKRMPNIKELYLWYDLEACSDCYPGNLGGFNKLESLSLYGCDSVQSFTFPSSLQELDIWGCSVDWEDIGMIMKSLPHLGFLHLGKVKGEEWRLADEEEFPCLKSLTIWECDDLIYWNANSSNFPVLETLDMYDLPKLSEIPIDMGDITTLARIRVAYCSVSAVDSALRIVVEQQITCGNQDLQIKVEFYKLEEVERFQKLVQQHHLKPSVVEIAPRR